MIFSSNWLTRSEAAQVAGVKPQTINNWLNNGIIPKSAILSVGRTRVRYSRSFFQNISSKNPEQLSQSGAQ
jgi:predicted site-specific integrase-resolvase